MYSKMRFPVSDHGRRVGDRSWPAAGLASAKKAEDRLLQVAKVNRADTEKQTEAAKAEFLVVTRDLEDAKAEAARIVRRCPENGRRTCRRSAGGSGRASHDGAQENCRRSFTTGALIMTDEPNEALLQRASRSCRARANRAWGKKNWETMIQSVRPNRASRGHNPTIVAAADAVQDFEHLGDKAILHELSAAEPPTGRACRTSTKQITATCEKSENIARAMGDAADGAWHSGSNNARPLRERYSEVAGELAALGHQAETPISEETLFRNIQLLERVRPAPATNRRCVSPAPSSTP